jgi:hypothetical protein
MFLLFMLGELVAILALYQFVIIPRVAEKTNNIFEERMLNKTWDIPAMLEDYTIHLAEVFSEIIKKLVPQVLGGHLGAGIKQLKADPENALLNASAEFMESLPFPAQLVANKFMPRLQEALDNAGSKTEEASVKYNPGLDRR